MGRHRLSSAYGESKAVVAIGSHIPFEAHSERTLTSLPLVKHIPFRSLVAPVRKPFLFWGFLGCQAHARFCVVFSKKMRFPVCFFCVCMVYYILSCLRRDGRVVEGAALEMLYRGNSIVGSNPTLSAIFILKRESSRFFPVFSIQPFSASCCALTPPPCPRILHASR